MTAAVEVMPAAEFDAWLAERAEQQDAGTSPLGEELWRGSCAKCHGLDGAGGYGPRIAGTELVADAEAVARLAARGPRADAAGRPRLGRRGDGRADRYLEESLGG